MQIANDPIMLKNPGVFWKTIIESSNVQVGQSILWLIAQTSAITDIDIGLGNKKIFFLTLKIIFFSPLKNIRRKQDLYSHLFNKRGAWNKRGGGAKIAKSLNVELGINEEGGIFGKN